MFSSSRPSATIAAALLVTCVACSDGRKGNNDARVDALAGDAGECVLRVAEINGREATGVSRLTGEDDLDEDTLGIQIDVKVQGTNLLKGTDVGLDLTGVHPEFRTTSEEGVVVFARVTVASNLDTVVIRTLAQGCVADERLLTVEPPAECLFVVPVDGQEDPTNKPGAALGPADDSNRDDEKFTHDVIVKTLNATGANTTLLVGDQVHGSRPSDTTGTTTFRDVVLPSGIVQLTAEMDLGGAKRSCKARIAVSSDLPRCNLSFDPPFVRTLDGTNNGVGVAQDVAPAMPGLQTDIVVDTESRVDVVTLFVDGVKANEIVTSGEKARFAKQTLPDTDGKARMITARCEDKETGAAQRDDLEVVVDSRPPKAVDNLVCFVASNRQGNVTCEWTTVGAEALRYQIRSISSDEPDGSPPQLDGTNWDSATARAQVEAEPVTGRRQSTLVTDLPLSRAYRFGIRSVDNVRNESSVDSSPGPDEAAVVVDFSTSAVPGPWAASAAGAVMAAGDFDCDGDTDLAVGDPTVNSNRGQVVIYLGTSRGYRTSLIKRIDGSELGGQFGSKVVSLPSFGGHSGCDDLAVVAAHGSTSKSKVFVYLGRSKFVTRSDLKPSTGAELVLSLPPSLWDETLGRTLASAGDFNGDGRTDLAVSEHRSGRATANVLIVFGQDLPLVGQDVLDPRRRDLPAAAGAAIKNIPAGELGHIALCGAGPLDAADSYGDIVIGAPVAALSSGGRGEIYVVRGGKGSGQEIPIDGAGDRVSTIEGTGDSEAFGKDVAVVGDMDGDGVAEIAASDPSVDADAGEVYVFSLATAPLEGVDQASFTVRNGTGSPRGNRLGLAIACAAPLADGKGDLNRDGYADLVVSVRAVGNVARGGVFVFRGGEQLVDRSIPAADHVFVAPDGSEAFGETLQWIGDLNRDGFMDLAVGDPDADDGRGRILAYY